MAINQSLAVALLATCIMSASPSEAAPRSAVGILPSSLALEAATVALNQCTKGGNIVSVSVVDASGELRVFIKADNATVHTRDASYRKAYTALSFGPIFNLDQSSAIAAKVRTNVNGQAFAGIPNILLLPGGVTIQDAGGVIGAIGVSGSADGMQDEACGQAGVAAIQARVK